jgi:hypothetical protein
MNLLAALVIDGMPDRFSRTVSIKREEGEMFRAARNGLLLVVLSGGFMAYSLSPSLAADKELRCDEQTVPGVNCTCDLKLLRPLQGAVGMGEVQEKAEKIEAKLEKEQRKLEADPIKVVRGPDGQLFITDHHHGARAWLLAGYSNGVCSIERDPSFGDAEKFWLRLEELKKVRLANKDGTVITPDALPKSLEQLPDDPYRTLAWMVRKRDGFCRTLVEQKEFAEFIWADWMRGRAELPAEQVAVAPDKMLDVALKLAKSPVAAGVSGYVGNEPIGFTCPDDE